MNGSNATVNGHIEPSSIVSSENTTTTSTMTSQEKLQVAVSALDPALPSQSNIFVKAVVTLIWPYSSSAQSLDLILAEQDFRLRYKKGQFKVHFLGKIAKHVAAAGLGSGDEVVLGLEGAEWTQVKSDGRGIEWDISFQSRLVAQIRKVGGGDIVILDVSEQQEQENDHSDEAAAPTLEPIAVDEPIAPFSPPRTNRVASLMNEEGEWSSPAFIKRARLSYGSFISEEFDEPSDDGSVPGKGRKRTKFGRPSGQYRYDSRSRSPTPVEEPAQPPPEPVKETPKYTTMDEGCQTEDLPYDEAEIYAIFRRSQAAGHQVRPGSSLAVDEATRASSDVDMDNDEAAAETFSPVVTFKQPIQSTTPAGPPPMHLPSGDAETFSPITFMPPPTTTPAGQPTKLASTTPLDTPPPKFSFGSTQSPLAAKSNMSTPATGGWPASLFQGMGYKDFAPPHNETPSRAQRSEPAECPKLATSNSPSAERTHEVDIAAEQHEAAAHALQEMITSGGTPVFDEEDVEMQGDDARGQGQVIEGSLNEAAPLLPPSRLVSHPDLPKEGESTQGAPVLDVLDMPWQYAPSQSPKVASKFWQQAPSKKNVLGMPWPYAPPESPKITATLSQEAPAKQNALDMPWPYAPQDSPKGAARMSQEEPAEQNVLDMPWPYSRQSRERSMTPHQRSSVPDSTPQSARAQSEIVDLAGSSDEDDESEEDSESEDEDEHYGIAEAEVYPENDMEEMEVTDDYENIHPDLLAADDAHFRASNPATSNLAEQEEMEDDEENVATSHPISQQHRRSSMSRLVERESLEEVEIDEDAEGESDSQDYRSSADEERFSDDEEQDHEIEYGSDDGDIHDPYSNDHILPSDDEDEEQEEYSLDGYDDENEMEEDLVEQRQQQPPPATPGAPVFIDLLSDSENEAPAPKPAAPLPPVADDQVKESGSQKQAEMHHNVVDASEQSDDDSSEGSLEDEDQSNDEDLSEELGQRGTELSRKVVPSESESESEEGGYEDEDMTAEEVEPQDIMQVDGAGASRPAPVAQAQPVQRTQTQAMQQLFGDGGPMADSDSEDSGDQADEEGLEKPHLPISSPQKKAINVETMVEDTGDDADIEDVVMGDIAPQGNEPPLEALAMEEFENEQAAEANRTQTVLSPQKVRPLVPVDEVNEMTGEEGDIEDYVPKPHFIPEKEVTETAGEEADIEDFEAPKDLVKPRPVDEVTETAGEEADIEDFEAPKGSFDVPEQQVPTMDEVADAIDQEIDVDLESTHESMPRTTTEDVGMIDSSVQIVEDLVEEQEVDEGSRKGAVDDDSDNFIPSSVANATAESIDSPSAEVYRKPAKEKQTPSKAVVVQDQSDDEVQPRETTPVVLIEQDHAEVIVTDDTGDDKSEIESDQEDQEQSDYDDDADITMQFEREIFASSMRIESQAASQVGEAVGFEEPATIVATQQTVESSVFSQDPLSGGSFVSQVQALPDTQEAFMDDELSAEEPNPVSPSKALPPPQIELPKRKTRGQQAKADLNKENKEPTAKHAAENVSPPKSGKRTRSQMEQKDDVQDEMELDEHSASHPKPHDKQEMKPEPDERPAKRMRSQKKQDTVEAEVEEHPADHTRSHDKRLPSVELETGGGSPAHHTRSHDHDGVCIEEEAYEKAVSPAPPPQPARQTRRRSRLKSDTPLESPEQAAKSATEQPKRVTRGQKGKAAQQPIEPATPENSRRVSTRSRASEHTVSPPDDKEANSTSILDSIAEEDAEEPYGKDYDWENSVDPGAAAALEFMDSPEKPKPQSQHGQGSESPIKTRSKVASQRATRQKAGVVPRQKTPERDVTDVGAAAVYEIMSPEQEKPPKTPLTPSAVKAQLNKRLRTDLADFTPLKGIKSHLGKKLDVLAICVATPENAIRATKGPRHYAQKVYVTDPSSSPAVAEVSIFRPHKTALPDVAEGDIILLRHFLVKAEGGVGLRSEDSSAWAVFKEGEEAHVKGPPVEYGKEEEVHAGLLRDWWGGLDAKERERMIVAGSPAKKTRGKK